MSVNIKISYRTVLDCMLRIHEQNVFGEIIRNRRTMLCKHVVVPCSFHYPICCVRGFSQHCPSKGGVARHGFRPTFCTSLLLYPWLSGKYPDFSLKKVVDEDLFKLLSLHLKWWTYPFFITFVHKLVICRRWKLETNCRSREKMCLLVARTVGSTLIL